MFLGEKFTSSFYTKTVVFVALAFGIFFRLAWPLEIEFKADEAYMFERSQLVGVSEPWPLLGMGSGVGTRNPSMSIWVFVALAKMTGAQDPVELTRCVQVMNCLALLGLLFFIFKFLKREEQEPWLWALALASVSPVGILLQRKIWAQSVLPLICVLMLMAWWKRKTFFGALCWSFLALIAAQIHMSGFFFFAALSVWTLLFGRSSLHIKGYIAGVVLGTIPMIPWLHYVLFEDANAGSRLPTLSHLVDLRFWGLWVTEGLGIDLAYNLKTDLEQMLKYPLYNAKATYFAGVVYVGIVGIFVFFLGQILHRLWQEKKNWKTKLLSNEPLPFLLNAVVVAYGVFMWLPNMNLYRHYLLITFPLGYLWFSWQVLHSNLRYRELNKFLLMLCLLFNVFLCFQLFTFLQSNGGAPNGDFGVSLRMQILRSMQQ